MCIEGEVFFKSSFNVFTKRNKTTLSQSSLSSSSPLTINSALSKKNAVITINHIGAKAFKHIIEIGNHTCISQISKLKIGIFHFCGDF